jgi:CheY-like chemotaxis protein
MKILVIEDEPTSLKLAHLVLSTDGNEVASAEAAEQAVDKILESEPEVILLDLELPNVDGLTLARNIKRDPARKHIIIIAVTSYPDRFPRSAALEAGCDAYIVKPISTRNLASQVKGIYDSLK